MGVHHVHACQPHGLRHLQAPAPTLAFPLHARRECVTPERRLRHGNHAPWLWLCWRGWSPPAPGEMPMVPSVDTRLQIPAMDYLLNPDEQGPLSLSVGQLIIWSLGL